MELPITGDGIELLRSVSDFSGLTYEAIADGVQHEPSRCGPTASRARLTPVFPFAVGSALGSNASASCPHLNRLSRVGGEDGREHRLCPTTPFCDCGNRSGSARAAGSNHERDRGVDAGNLPFQRDVVWHLAGVALLLAALGYGVLSFLVTQRRQAIGTRMASRASKSGVRKVFVRQGLALTVAGIRVGIAGARFVSRWLTSLLSGVTPADPFSFVAVSLELLAVTGAGSYLRAGRAVAIDPMAAIRSE
jgi:hypothetical protein